MSNSKYEQLLAMNHIAEVAFRLEDQKRRKADEAADPCSWGRFYEWSKADCSDAIERSWRDEDAERDGAKTD